MWKRRKRGGKGPALSCLYLMAQRCEKNHGRARAQDQLKAIEIHSYINRPKAKETARIRKVNSMRTTPTLFP